MDSRVKRTSTKVVIVFEWWEYKNNGSILMSQQVEGSYPILSCSAFKKTRHVIDIGHTIKPGS